MATKTSYPDPDVSVMEAQAGLEKYVATRTAALCVSASEGPTQVPWRTFMDELARAFQAGYLAGVDASWRKRE